MSESEEERLEHVDWYNETAKRVHGKPDGWKWCSLDSHQKPPGYIEVHGAVPIGTVSRGPRKGRTRWPPKSECDIVWMQDSEINETMRLWEIETGKCSACRGNGNSIVGWSREGGNKYRECKKCSGSGLSLVEEAGS